MQGKRNRDFVSKKMLLTLFLWQYHGYNKRKFTGGAKRVDT